MHSQFIKYIVVFALLSGFFAGPPAHAEEGENIPDAATGDTGGPIFAPDSTIFDLGIIPDEQQRVVGLVPFVNRGKQTLEILKVNGACDCYQGFDGDRKVEPGASGFLEIFYDKNKIPAGTVRRNAKIETNDSEHSPMTVYFDFIINRSDEEEERRQMRDDIQSLRKELRLVRQDLKKVLSELATIKTSVSQAPAPQKKAVDATVYEIPSKGSPILGPESASVKIVEFSDFQCPYCIREYPKIQQMIKEFPGQVNMVFKHFPLNFHKKAKPVHAACELAFQEKGHEGFWKMHDKIIANPKQLEVSHLRSYAQELGLDLTKFDQVLSDTKAIESLLREDVAIASKCKVRGTPTVLVNGLKLADRSLAGYRNRIKQILAETKKQ